MLVGDINAEESELSLSQLFDEYNAKNIVKENTCFKNTLNSSCIGLFITNIPLSFQNTITISNGLWDFHKMVITVMKMYLRNIPLSNNNIEITNILIRPNSRITYRYFCLWIIWNYFHWTTEQTCSMKKEIP